jgi:uncharacterized protein (DUF433 family)
MLLGMATLRTLDARDEPAYLVDEAAHYLGLPRSTVRVWAVGQRRGASSILPLIKPAMRRPPTLSFWNLVELYVLASIRRRYKVSMPRVRRALQYVSRELGKSRPLIEEELLTDGVSLLVDRFSRLINVSEEGQIALRRVLEASLQRIDRDPKGLAQRLYPWTKDPAEPRHVVIDPLRSFGKPMLDESGVPTEILAERFHAGDSIKALARDYGLDPELIEVALRWETRAAQAA